MTSDRIQSRIELLLDDADTAAGAHQWEEVLSLTAAILAIDPDHGDARHLERMSRAALNLSADTAASDDAGDGEPEPEFPAQAEQGLALETRPDESAASEASRRISLLMRDSPPPVDLSAVTQTASGGTDRFRGPSIREQRRMEAGWRGRLWAFNSPGTRSGFATAALVAFVGATLLLIWARVEEISALEQLNDGRFVSISEANRIDNFLQFAGVLYMAAFAASAVCFLVWLHRAGENLYSISTRERSYSAGWAIGWWFIPVAFIWMPFRVVSEIWRTSAHGDDADQYQASGLMWLWWLAWIAFALLSGEAASAEDTSTDGAIAAGQFQIFVVVIGAVAAGLAILVVRKISSLQEAAFRARVRAAEDSPEGAVDRR